MTKLYENFKTWKDVRMKKFKLYEYVEKLSKNDLIVTSNVEKNRDVVINKVCYNSNDVEKDTLFVCKGVNLKRNI